MPTISPIKSSFPSPEIAPVSEIVRHSWLSEYAHIVEFITSSTTSPWDVQNGNIGIEEFDARLIMRSASVREAAKQESPQPAAGGLSKPHAKINSPRMLHTTLLMMPSVAPCASNTLRQRYKRSSVSTMTVGVPQAPRIPQNFENDRLINYFTAPINRTEFDREQSIKPASRSLSMKWNNC